MIKDKYDIIITKLMDATGKGTVVWEKTSSNDEFQVKLGANAVTISYYDPSDWVANLVIGSNELSKKESCSLSIINSEGVIIDNETIEKGERGYERLKTLYDEARRKYFKVDETLDDILNTLK